MTMIERVARALWRQYQKGDTVCPPGETYNPPEVHYDYHAAAPFTGAAFLRKWEDLARAALEAMREPDPKMIAMARLALRDDLDPTDDEIADIYRAMIDAALGKA